jgi:uncharacterized protein YeaO (DUF488 family)
MGKLACVTQHWLCLQDKKKKNSSVSIELVIFTINLIVTWMLFQEQTSSRGKIICTVRFWMPGIPFRSALTGAWKVPLKNCICAFSSFECWFITIGTKSPRCTRVRSFVTWSCILVTLQYATVRCRRPENRWSNFSSSFRKHLTKLNHSRLEQLHNIAWITFLVIST